MLNCEFIYMQSLDFQIRNVNTERSANLKCKLCLIKSTFWKPEARICVVALPTLRQARELFLTGF